MGKTDIKKLVEKTTNEIIGQIGLKATAEVVEEDTALKVSIEGDQLGVLIGYHGDTLESLQLLLTLIANRQTGEEDWRRVVVDIGGWRAERRESLKSVVNKAAADIQELNLDHVSLPIMSASQRREVHVLLGDNFPELTSQSEGEEPHRFIVISKK